VLGKIPSNSVDVDAIFQHARLYPPKTLETKHEIIIEELAAPLILGLE